MCVFVNVRLFSCSCELSLSFFFPILLKYSAAFNLPCKLQMSVSVGVSFVLSACLLVSIVLCLSVYLFFFFVFSFFKESFRSFEVVRNVSLNLVPLAGTRS